MKVQQQQININGLSIRYWEAGTEEALPLVLLHGTGESALDWSWVIPKLAEKYHVYAPDFPGTGESAKPIRDYSLDFLAQFVADFLQALNLERVALAGNSLGGLVSICFSLSYPEKVMALILVDSSGLGEAVNPFLSSLTIPVFGDVAIQGAKTPVGAMVRSRSRSALLFNNPAKVPAEWYAEQERLAQTPGFLEANLSTLRAQLHPIGQCKIMLEQLEYLEMPSLVIWGTNDLIVPKSQAEAAVKRLPQGKLALIPNCGHIPHLECPEQFSAAVIEFLSQVTES